ncbi:MAG: response regulator [Deltaproteobacteria bacterium]|nr:MAG: response regulator [Deltaproteobacteria bacterium]
MPKILVVDDEKSIRLLYQEELADEGYDVVTAESGHRLLEKIEQEGPDLIVLDIKMMEYNGLDLLQDIRNRYYNLPVILCSAYEVFKQDMKAIAADAYVVKSSDLTQLKRAISRALESRRADLGKGEG